MLLNYLVAYSVNCKAIIAVYPGDMLMGFLPIPGNRDTSGTQGWGQNVSALSTKRSDKWRCPLNLGDFSRDIAPLWNAKVKPWHPGEYWDAPNGLQFKK
ncbi:hypothetical protein SUGI_1131550 [Cryptomeria japonica]|nr:hypothetical protein SUGI_1131550 [Cryptomeria japonica]